MTALRIGFFAVRRSCRRLLLHAPPRVSANVAQFCDSAPSGDDGETNRTKGRQPKPGEMLKNGDIYPVVDPLTSIQYMESEAYREAYGDEPVWERHRRNFKGQFAPETRKTCIRGGILSTGNPCPVCRDEYLVIHYKNVKLLNQFISPYTGEILPSKTTSICQRQLKLLRIEVEKAQHHGLIEISVPFKKYNYADYLDVTPS